MKNFSSKLKSAIDIIIGGFFVFGIVALLIYGAGKLGLLDETEYGRCGPYSHWKVNEHLHENGHEIGRECVPDRSKR